MKVLLISHLAPPAGGIATWTRRVLEKGLGKWDIVHINLNTINGRDPFKNPKRNIKDELIRSFRVWKQEIHSLKNKHDIKVVHTNIPCTVYGMLREMITGSIAKFYNKKFIVHCHCTVPNVVNSWWKKILFRVLSKLCDGFIVLNKKSADFAKQNSKVHVVLIPNFVTREELTGSCEKLISKEVKNVIYVGGVTAEKGCDTIIEAAKRLPQMTFHLVGIIPKEIEVMERSDNVILYGDCEKDKVKEKLSESDVFLFLSHYWGEGFSCALTEAMAAGLPCVVTDWAANADMIENKGGLVIPKQNAVALVDVLNKLDGDKNGREFHSKWNVNKVVNHYMDDVVLNQYTDFYDELVSNG